MGVEISNWRGARDIPLTPLEGRFARIELLDIRRHGADLWQAFGGSAETVSRHLQHTGLPRFDSREAFVRSFAKASRATLLDRLVRPFRRGRPRRLYFACIDQATGRAAGLRCLAQIDYVHGSVESALAAVGGTMLRTPASTEVFYLIARMLFETCGFRRLESHVAVENEPARRNVERTGWRYDGILRQRYVHDGHSFDAAIYTILADEWPRVGDALRAWLHPTNFDAGGRQVRRLEDFRI